MVRSARVLLAIFAAALASLPLGIGARAGEGEQRRVNVLLITVDDMNWNSVGAFGNPIEGITPHIDRLAREGRRFERAYVVASNCAPSRVALQTGLYPQQSGATGFFYVDDEDIPSIATELAASGYYTGLVNKVADTDAAPDHDTNWDYRAGLAGAKKYSADEFGKRSATFFDGAKRKGQPFYLVINIADPHKPNYNDKQATRMGADGYPPSRIIGEAEINVPAFLPDLPAIRRDLRNYYNSVKRADDTVGAILAALHERGLEEDTLVIFLSDHGMPFPFAKSSVYDNGLRTPLIMKFPGKIEPDSVEPRIVSAVDLMPTILDVAGADMPVHRPYFGRALLGHEEPADAPFAFGGFDENAQGYPVPMRGVISPEWGYVFNAWADGEHTIRSAAMYHQTFAAMVRNAKRNPEVAARLDYFRNRATEELCHLKSDPGCLVNLVSDPAYADVLAKMQTALRAQMVRTDDYLLEAFDIRSDQAQLQAFMRREHRAAETRAARYKWKRATNLAGKTSGNSDLFGSGDN